MGPGKHASPVGQAQNCCPKIPEFWTKNLDFWAKTPEFLNNNFALCRQG